VGASRRQLAVLILVRFGTYQWSDQAISGVHNTLVGKLMFANLTAKCSGWPPLLEAKAS